ETHERDSARPGRGHTRALARAAGDVLPHDARARARAVRHAGALANRGRRPAGSPRAGLERAVATAHRAAECVSAGAPWPRADRAQGPDDRDAVPRLDEARRRRTAPRPERARAVRT